MRSTWVSYAYFHPEIVRQRRRNLDGLLVGSSQGPRMISLCATYIIVRGGRSGSFSGLFEILCPVQIFENSVIIFGSSAHQISLGPFGPIKKSDPILTFFFLWAIESKFK
ncbi:hypothetical protein YC2023_066801 [Brassica napus]